MVFLSLVFLCLSILKKGDILKKEDIFLFITVAFLIFSAIIHSEFSGGYISIISLFVLGSCFFATIDAKQFVKVFLDIMTIICIVSLFTFFFAPFASKLPLFPSIYNINNVEYRFFFFSNISVINPERNYGLFTEPSRFQAYLNLSLIFMIFTEKEKLDMKRIVLFIVTLITTFSTTGFIAFAIILAAFLFSGRVKMNGIYKALIVIVIIAVVAFLATQDDYFLYSINKVTMGEKSHSAATRINSFFATFKVISENFFFGTGIKNANAAFAKALSDLGGAFASTNTITILIVFSKFGIVPGLFYTYNMYQSVKSMSNNKNTLILVIAFIAMTCGITFVDSIIFNLILFYRNKQPIDNIGKVEQNESLSY